MTNPPAAIQHYTRPRPKLTKDNVVEYLDWIAENVHNLTNKQLETHMQAAELTVRTLTTDARGKATQHTLIEDGTIPPTARIEEQLHEDARR